MGIRGLTTFVQNRSHLYLEDYELHDINVVIDGNAIACQLYNWHCKSNDCFGGDYDKYAAVIKNFFQILSNCNITPYIVFDGGYESRKIATVISRMKNRIKSARHLNSVTEGSVSVFPLFLRETFLDIILELNIKCVRCDFESDTEIANIARTLNCPVLSYDSDFFIFDVLYVPFSTFEMSARKKKKTQWSEAYTYVLCKVYRIETFLKSFGLDKSILPILAVLLGNDYVKRSVFSMFYKHLKIQKCHGNQNDQQKRIKSVIVWLQNESTESAIQKVLSRYKCKRRKLIAAKIRNAIKGYNCTDSMYLQYLQIEPIVPKETVEINLDIAAEEGNEDDNLEDSENDVSDSEEEKSSSSEDVDVSDFKSEPNSDLPTIFLEKYRRCLYPPSFMDILIQNKYYCIPQVENDALEYSHSISSEILSAIQGILRNSTGSLVCVARTNNGHVRNRVLPHCDVDLPSLYKIQNLDLASRRALFLRILKIEDRFVENCLNSFPESWYLLILALKYFVDKSAVTWPMIYALLVSKIFLGYVDKYVGNCRSRKAFEKIINSHQIPENNCQKSNDSFKLTIKDALEEINCNDSVVCLKQLFQYFHVDLKMKISNRLYDRDILHSMAQFQSCLLHLKYLNNLLNLPFSNFTVSDIFNGTLIYNLSVNFMKRANLDNYIAILLQNSHTILNCVKLVVEKLKEHLNALPCDAPVKRRKKKRKIKEVDVDDHKQSSSEDEGVFDPNNKYSILTCSGNS